MKKHMKKKSNDKKHDISIKADRPFLGLDTLNTSFIDSDKKITSPPKSPSILFHGCPRIYGKNLMKQSRLVFQSAKCNEKKISLPNKPTSILPKTEENSISDISLEKVFVTSKSNASSTNETVEDDVVELSPTESRSNRARRLKEKLKRNDINDINNINLCDTENKPPVEILLKKNRKKRKKNIPEQLNMRCKADRAKIDGWDCWECKQYYKNLSLMGEKLQKRRNQVSRHRHRYERPANTPEGFWNPEFPETSTYRQNLN
ncbi:DNA endonuclease RBBP8-like [Linepithema humile]|uniref:DNA endonuclease RBBP8-like n=1 Tax=Linepithema humile TaxID=83485 RepID=UPI00351DE8EC